MYLVFWLENGLVHLKTKQERTAMLLRPLPSFQLEVILPPRSFLFQTSLKTQPAFRSALGLHPPPPSPAAVYLKPGRAVTPVPCFLSALENKHLGPFLFLWNGVDSGKSSLARLQGGRERQESRVLFGMALSYILFSST